MPQPGRKQVSAGVLVFRRTPAGTEFLLAHPGGPFWRHRDEGAWTIPKGIVNEGEDFLAAARREFSEETGAVLEGPFLPLGSIRQKGGKVVHAWAVEADLDPSTFSSNMASTQWPPRSGKWISYPEVDRAEWLDGEAARIRINAAQAELIDRLEAQLPAT